MPETYESVDRERNELRKERDRLIEERNAMANMISDNTGFCGSEFHNNPKLGIEALLADRKSKTRMLIKSRQTLVETIDEINAELKRLREANAAMLAALPVNLNGAKRCPTCNRTHFQVKGITIRHQNKCALDDCPGYIVRAAIARAEEAKDGD